MILATGDLHGNWGKLNQLIQKKKPTTVLQTGDFGWWPSMEIKRPVLYGQQRPWTLQGVKANGTDVYWCDGNHEEHPLLPQDGETHTVYPGVTFCSRGSVVGLPDGRRVLFMGGAASVDKNLRTPGHDWFPEEAITNEQLDRAMSHDGRIDVVISHTCPCAFTIHGDLGNMKTADPSRVALQYILQKYQPPLWIFGHWHKNQQGKVGGTYWEALDYPGHGGRWWREI